MARPIKCDTLLAAALILEGRGAGCVAPPGELDRVAAILRKIVEKRTRKRAVRAAVAAQMEDEGR